MGASLTPGTKPSSENAATSAPVPFHTNVTDSLRELRAIDVPIERYLYIRRLRQQNPQTYHALLYKHVQEVLPYVYTPTVGEACQKYHRLSLNSWGVYLSYDDKGSILEKLQNLNVSNSVKIIVVTDGERVLGLGDLGTGGMGISEGKILLYTVAAGVDPTMCLPMCIDVGTNSQKLLDDPEYKGLRRERVGREQYDDFMKEFVQALKDWQPHTVLQFEDFGNHNAFRILENFREDKCCFNDDIQGTACIVLAAVLSAIRVTGTSIDQQKFVFLGAGEAGIGIGDLLAAQISKHTGKSIEEARQHCLFLDRKGLVCNSRIHELQEHKKSYAHDLKHVPDLISAVTEFKPTAIIGVSTNTSAFNQEVIEEMSRINERPLIFPLSNPTSKSECTFQEAMEWSDGRALFASGSPFEPYTHKGVVRTPAQANNAYVFPALGHAAMLAKAKMLPEEVFLTIAEVLSSLSSVEDVEKGFLFPPFNDIIPVSKKIILKLCEYFEDKNLGSRPAGMEWEDIVNDSMWSPTTVSLQSRM